MFHFIITLVHIYYNSQHSMKLEMIINTKTQSEKVDNDCQIVKKIQDQTLKEVECFMHMVWFSSTVDK